MAVRRIRIKVGERWYSVEVEEPLGSPAKVTVDGEIFEIEVEGGPRPAPAFAPPPSALSRPVTPAPASTGPAPLLLASDRVVRAPMPGKVIAVRVKPGDQVAAGDEVCVVEAMKMEQSLRAALDGVVKRIHVKPLQQVGMNDPLVELE